MRTISPKGSIGREGSDRRSASEAAGGHDKSGPYSASFIARYWPLWICFLIAIIVRAWLVIHTNGSVEGDEALVGIQAQHILQGERPIYFYGQPYMGSLEAYLIAIVFAIAGSSVWTLRVEPILLSLAVVWLTWRLAAILTEYAQLPLYARRSFMVLATLLAALPPLYDSVAEIHTWGGYIETFVLMLLLLLSVLQLTRRWDDGASLRELALRWAGIGFLVGLGFWIHALIISAVSAGALWIGGYCIARLLRERGRSKIARTERQVISIPQGLCAALIGIPPAFLGSAPALYWGATHNWENVTYLVNRGTGRSIGDIGNLAQVYFTCVAPRVIGGGLLAESPTQAALHALPLALGLFCIFATVVLVVISFFLRSLLLVQNRRLVALPLLFAVFTALFCFISSNPLDCSRDLIGHFATPLALVLPFFIAAIFTALAISIHERVQRQTQVGEGNGEEQGRPQEQEAGGRSRKGPQGYAPTMIPRSLSGLLRTPRLTVTAQRMLFVLLCVSLFAQIWTYAQTDPGTTFQSPFCTDGLANNDAVIAYMQQQHIQYAWAVPWIGYPIDFKMNGSIIIADPGPLMSHFDSIDRMPTYIDAVNRADRPSMLAFIEHGDPHPLLLTLLDDDYVTYRAVIFPSDKPYLDVLLVTPLNKTVSPLDFMAFKSVFYPCEE